MGLVLVVSWSPRTAVAVWCWWHSPQNLPAQSQPNQTIRRWTTPLPGAKCPSTDCLRGLRRLRQAQVVFWRSVKIVQVLVVNNDIYDLVVQHLNDFLGKAETSWNPQLWCFHSCVMLLQDAPENFNSQARRRYHEKWLARKGGFTPNPLIFFQCV